MLVADRSSGCQGRADAIPYGMPHGMLLGTRMPDHLPAQSRGRRTASCQRPTITRGQVSRSKSLILETEKPYGAPDGEGRPDQSLRDHKGTDMKVVLAGSAAGQKKM